MTWHTLAYFLAIGTVALTDVPALADDIVQIQNNHFILNQGMKLIAAAVFSPTIVEAQLVSPTIRQINPVDIRGLNASAIGVSNPAVYWAQGGGADLYPFEETQILGTAAPATTENFTAILLAGTPPTPVPAGNVFPVKLTSTAAAVANKWTSILYGLSTVIPSGTYNMIWSELFSTNNIAHRWIFSNQVWRPGFWGGPSTASRQSDLLTAQGMGVMGSFKSNDLPRLQTLANVADASHTGFMYIQRTGPI